MLLAIAPSLAGSEVTFVGEDAADQLWLKREQDGNLAYSTTSRDSGYSVDLDLATPGDQPHLLATLTKIDVQLKGGKDLLAVVGDSWDATIGIQVRGGADWDQLQGGAGSDTLDGGDGEDQLSAGGGNDALAGGDGNDVLDGGEGADVLNGGGGNDALRGGPDDDTYSFSPGWGQDTVYEAANAGLDTLDFSLVPAALRIKLLDKGKVEVSDGTTLGANTVKTLPGNVEVVKLSEQITHTLDLRSLSGVRLWVTTDTTLPQPSGVVVVKREPDGTELLRLAGVRDITSLAVLSLYDGKFVRGTVVPSLDETERAVTFTGMTTRDGLWLYQQDGKLAYTTNKPGTDVSLDLDGTTPGVQQQLVAELTKIRVRLQGDSDSLTVAEESWTVPMGVEVQGGSGRDTLKGSKGADTLAGEDGDDALEGRDGADLLAGGAGNDTLRGGPGDDVYSFLAGWGKDTVYEEADEGLDRLDFSTVSAALTVKLSDTGAVEVADGTSSSASSVKAAGNVEIVQLSGQAAHTLDLGEFAFRVQVTTDPALPQPNDVVVVKRESDGTELLRLTGVDDITSLVVLGSNVTGTVVPSLSREEGILNSSVSFTGLGTADALWLKERDGLLAYSTARDGTRYSTDLDLKTSGAQVAYQGHIDSLAVELGSGDDWLKLAGLVLLTPDGGQTPVVAHGGPGDDFLESAAGPDVLFGDDGNDTLLGADGNDVLSGDDGNDILDGGQGADRLNGGTGADVLLGGDGADRLLGEEGDDALDGGAGNDVLDGGAGADQLNGGDGDDVLSGGEGTDVLRGGPGDDTYSFRENWGQDTVYEEAGEGSDELDFSNTSMALTVKLTGTGTVEVADGTTSNANTVQVPAGNVELVRTASTPTLDLSQLDFPAGVSWDSSARQVVVKKHADGAELIRLSGVTDITDMKILSRDATGTVAAWLDESKHTVTFKGTVAG